MAAKQTPWKTVAKRYAIDSKYLRIRQETVQLPTGEIYDDYFINESPGWVCVFCLTRQGTVILNRQYKHGIGEYVLELPAGAREESESAEECARRELLEETGYEAPQFEHVVSLIVDPTFSEGRMHLFFCRDATPGGRRSRDPRERIKNRFVSVSELVALLRAGKINVLGHVAAIYTVLDRKMSLLAMPRESSAASSKRPHSRR
jgi:ADP-ribose pyrophosphatase